MVRPAKVADREVAVASPLIRVSDGDELYLPRTWRDDADRRAGPDSTTAGVPREVAPRPPREGWIGGRGWIGRKRGRRASRPSRPSRPRCKLPEWKRRLSSVSWCATAVCGWPRPWPSPSRSRWRPLLLPVPFHHRSRAMTIDDRPY